MCVGHSRAPQILVFLGTRKEGGMVLGVAVAVWGCGAPEPGGYF